MNSKIIRKIEKDEARQKNPIVLAYIGDTVFDLYVRNALVAKYQYHVNELNKRAVAFVNAHAQAMFYDYIEEELTEEEINIAKRARNSSPGTTAKNMSKADYMKATGLEALIGFLHMSGEYDRVDYLMEKILKREKL